MSAHHRQTTLNKRWPTAENTFVVRDLSLFTPLESHHRLVGTIVDHIVELTLRPIAEYRGGARYELWLSLDVGAVAISQQRRFRVRPYNLRRDDQEVDERQAFRLIEAALTGQGAIRPRVEDLIEIMLKNRSDTLSLFVADPSRFTQRDTPYFQSMFATVFHGADWTLGDYMDIALRLELLLPFEGSLGIGMVGKNPFHTPLIMLLGETW
ncbi:hypothetical protein [Stutzerimonas stutzeri]|uniref:Uncharacterized protein n=1 Tax=Stutzerimonas stutzeri TaxID=316 RepID=A0A5S5B3M7_STUST|nr:hypothetical protein [Stutzerimonas stutzeri]TYP61487.1 hypothetical protein A9A72_124223 [Stutzerimonas stutzeri]